MEIDLEVAIRMESDALHTKTSIRGDIKSPPFFLAGSGVSDVTDMNLLILYIYYSTIYNTFHYIVLSRKNTSVASVLSYLTQ